MDQAVRAALSRRPTEPRSFSNEDDLEGPKMARAPRRGRREPGAH